MPDTAPPQAPATPVRPRPTHIATPRTEDSPLPAPAAPPAETSAGSSTYAAAAPTYRPARRTQAIVTAAPSLELTPLLPGPYEAALEHRAEASVDPAALGKRVAAVAADVVLAVVTLGIGWLVWSLISWSKGQTPGKSLLGLRCVRTDTGDVASWSTMAKRELLGKTLLGTVTAGVAGLVSCVLVLGSSRQGLWDKVAGTLVVDDVR